MTVSYQVPYLSASHSYENMKATMWYGVFGCASAGANALRDVLTSEQL